MTRPRYPSEAPQPDDSNASYARTVRSAPGTLPLLLAELTEPRASRRPS